MRPTDVDRFYPPCTISAICFNICTTNMPNYIYNNKLCPIEIVFYYLKHSLTLHVVPTCITFYTLNIRLGGPYNKFNSMMRAAALQLQIVGVEIAFLWLLPSIILSHQREKPLSVTFLSPFCFSSITQHCE